MNKRKLVVFSMIEITCLLLFLFQLVLYKQRYINIETKKQQQLTEAYATHLKTMDEESMIQFLSSLVNESNQQYAILLKNNHVIYLRDQVIKNEGMLAAENLSNSLNQKNIVITTTQWQSDTNKYELWYVIDVKTMLYEVNLDIMNLKLSGIVIVNVLLNVMIIILLSDQVNKYRVKSRRLNQLLIKQRMKEEELTEELKKKEFIWKEEKSSTHNTYDEEILYSFLHKSTDAQLYPMNILLIKLYLGNRYYSKDELTKVKEAIQLWLNENQILCEIRKGEFCVLLYQTEFEQAMFLKRKLLQYFRQNQEFQKYRMKAKVMQVDETTNNAREVYEILRSDVTNMIRKGSHSYEV